MADPAPPAVLLDIDAAGIARIRLNRPKAANGMNDVLLPALYETVMKVHGDPRVRVVLLSGEGKHFCAGGDVHDFLSKGDQLSDYLKQLTSTLQVAAAALIHLEVPVVTAVQGFAAGGGGLGLVCCSDLVIAGESAKFLAGATRVGMAPDAGVSVTLSRIVGFRKAMEILLTNPVLSAKEAEGLGLVNRVVPDAELEAASLALAQELSRGAPKALAETKRLLWEGISLGVEQAFPDESRTVSMLSGTADAREGLMAVIEKRPPVFRGR